MNFSGKNVELKSYVSKFINPGINEVKINSMEVLTASTGTKRVQFNVEGVEVKDSKFEGIDGAKGQVGRIKSGYLKSDQQQIEFIKDMKQIAVAIGMEADFNNIEAKTFDAYLEKLVTSPALKGKFFRAIVTGEEYENSGKKRWNLGFGRFKFVESMDIPTSETKLKFDPTKSYHIRRMDVSSPEMVGQMKDNDLPF